jgi:retron-type reverse transcriptase
VISPLLSNIYLGVLDKVGQRRHAHLGELVRYADDFVVLSRTSKACEEAEVRIRERFFLDHGHHRLGGTVKYPEAA